MKITREQRDAWRFDEENQRWENEIGPRYKNPDGTADVEKLYEVADLNGLRGLRSRYEGLNPGQISMNVRNRLRPIWRAGKLL